MRAVKNIRPPIPQGNGSQTLGTRGRPLTAFEILQRGRSVTSPKASPGQFTEVLNPLTSTSVQSTPLDSYNLANDKGHYIRQKIQRDLKNEAAETLARTAASQIAKRAALKLLGPASFALDLYDLYDLARNTEWVKGKRPSMIDPPPNPTGEGAPTVPGNWVPRFEWSDAIGAAGGTGWQYRDVGRVRGAGTSSQIIGDPGSSLWSNIGSKPKYRVKPTSTEISAVGPHPAAGGWGVNGSWYVPPNTTQPNQAARPRRATDVAPDSANAPDPNHRPGDRSNPDRRRHLESPGKHPYAPTHGPRPASRPSPRRRPSPITDPMPTPANKPRPIAPPMIIGGPGTLPKTIPNTTGHNSTPPGPGEKERKTIANPRAGSLTSWLVGTVTESLDFIEAFHDAIPPELTKRYYKDSNGKWRQAKGTSPANMLKDIYEHFDKLDLNEALKNVLINQLQDAAIGRLGRAAQKEAKPLLDLLGRPVGFGTGPAI